MVTPVCAVLGAATGDCDPVYGGCGCILPRGHAAVAAWPQGQQQFSSGVVQSQAGLGQSQIVTLLTALSMVHIGMTTLD